MAQYATIESLKKYSSNIKTVDAMVEYFTAMDSDHNVRSAICYILSDFHIKLLTILKSKDNKPSKYDILIIQIINEPPGGKTFKSILNVYSNREVS